MACRMSGKPLASQMREDIKQAVAAWRTHGVVPRMVTILVGDSKASVVYAEQKAQKAHTLGIANQLVRLPANVSQATLIRQIGEYNHDKSTHGIMLELPLPEHIDAAAVISAIDPLKDVDGLTRMVGTDAGRAMYPATPLACLALLDHYDFTLAGKHVALVGCGRTVGIPLLQLLIQAGATVTACHAGTVDLRSHVRGADIVIVAVGKSGLITPDMVRPQQIIVDAGINETATGGVVGDVAPEVANFVTAMSPTPGGVGCVTTMQLFTNLLRATAAQLTHTQAAVLAPVSV